MALIRDPNWTGPGPGPLIDDGTGSTDTDGRGQFTPEQAAAIDAAANLQQGTLVMLLQQIIFVNFNRVLWVVVRILRLR
jgi:hypothetical protein